MTQGVSHGSSSCSPERWLQWASVIVTVDINGREGRTVRWGREHVLHCGVHGVPSCCGCGSCSCRIHCSVGVVGHHCTTKRRVVASGIWVRVHRVVGEGDFLDRSSSTSTIVTLFEENLVCGIQHPVVAFAILASLCWEFHEAFVEGEVVSNGVPPALVLSVAVVGKVLCYEVVNAVQSQPLFLRALYRHGDERNVRVWWLHVCHLVVTLFVSVRHIQLDASSRHRCHGLRLFVTWLAHLYGFFQSLSELLFAYWPGVALTVSRSTHRTSFNWHSFVRLSQYWTIKVCKTMRKSLQNWLLSYNW